MDKDNIKFDVSSMDETMYRLKEISALSSEEVDKLEKEKQVLFVVIRKDIEPITNVLVMGPKVWFADEDDFIERVETDLRKYLIAGFEDMYADSAADVCEIIDNMGLVTFINYIPYELISQYGNTYEDMDDYEDFGELDGEAVGELKMLICSALNDALISSRVLYGVDETNRLLEKAEVHEGVMCVQTEYGSSMKEAYVMKIRMLNDYRDEGSTANSYIGDLKEFYSDYLTREWLDE